MITTSSLCLALLGLFLGVYCDEDYLLSPLVFDALFYINDNPDIMFAEVLTEEEAQIHWLTLGAEEGRQGCGSFHSKQYLHRYQDLQNAFGSNYTQAILHYVETGHSENRFGYVEGGFPTPFGTRWTISNGQIFISSSERMGAGIDSLVWNNRQFLNAHDHGRGMQMKCETNIHGNCFSPTECGGRDDSNGPTTTTHVISATSHGHTLQSKVYPAFWLRPGTFQTLSSGGHCRDGSPALNKNVTYTYPLQKQVTIGCAGSANCIQFTSTFTLGGTWPDGFNYVLMEAPMVYLAMNFTKAWHFNIHNHHFQNNTNIRSHTPVAMGTEDGRYVLGIYAPAGQDSNQHQFYGTYHFYHTFPGSTHKLNVVFSKRVPVKPTSYTYITYICVGNLHVVKDCMTKVLRHNPHV